MSSAKKIEIGSSVTSISDYAFYFCGNLTTMTIPNSVISIEDCAFWFCDILTSVTIPDSVTKIGIRAFADCEALESITITANGGNAQNVKNMLIDAGVPSSITWNMPS